MDKRTLRTARWLALREAGVARFPGVEGRIPNFTGAEKAAAHLAHQAAWKAARVLASNPELPQRPARYRALQEGKVLYVPAPNLAEYPAFACLDPERLAPNRLWEASSIVGALSMGQFMHLEDLEPVDLILAGCVAVARDGSRLGRGCGSTDLSYALFRESGIATAQTPIFSTAHPSQVVRKGIIPMEGHDVWLDGFATPERFFAVSPLSRDASGAKQPTGLVWDLLQNEPFASLPVLEQWKESRPRKKA